MLPTTLMMTKAFIIALSLLWCVVVPLSAQTVILPPTSGDGAIGQQGPPGEDGAPGPEGPEGPAGAGITRGVAADRPVTPISGEVYVVTDGIVAGDCLEGLGTTVVFCVWNGTDWQAMARGLRGNTVAVTALSGATGTATAAIPAGAIVMSVTTAIQTDVTGAGVTGYEVGDGVDPDRWGVASALVAGTVTDSKNFTVASVGQVYTTATDVILTAVGGTFASGAVNVTSWYLDGTALGMEPGGGGDGTCPTCLQIADRDAADGVLGLSDAQINNPGPALGAVLIEQAGAPSAGICAAHIQLYVQTGVTPNRFWFCNGTEGSNAVDLALLARSVNQVTDGTNSFTCDTDGGCTLTVVAGDESTDVTVDPVTGEVSIAAAGMAALPCLNPRNPPYNAVGDGVADDTLAIQTAINDAYAVTTRRRLVCLASGTYKITQLKLRPGVDFLGESINGTRISPADGTNLDAIILDPAFFTGTTYWHWARLGNFTLTKNLGGAVTDTLGSGIHIADRMGEGSKIENIFGGGFPEAGIKFSRGGNPVHLQNITMSGNGTYGFHVERTGSDIWANVSMIQLVGSDNGTALIYLKTAGSANESFSIHGIKSESGPTGKQSNIILAEGLSARHIYISGSSSVSCNAAAPCNAFLKIGTSSARVLISGVSATNLTNLIDDVPQARLIPFDTARLVYAYSSSNQGGQFEVTGWNGVIVGSKLRATGNAPAISSCGTSPSLTNSTDSGGELTAGTGTVTSCTVTFTSAWPTSNPSCFATNKTDIQLMRAVASTTVLTITSATDFAGDVITYGCIGRR